jgi:competence protein ComEC
MITLVCFVIGFWRTDQFHHQYPFNAFDHYHNQTITIVGTIHSAPVIKPGKQLVQIKPELINGAKIPQKTRDIVLSFSDLESFHLGDRLVVSGKFTLRENFTSDTGRIVQYRLMSYSKKIAGDIRYPHVEQVVHTHNHSVWNMFVAIKKSFTTTLNQLFVAPASGLLSGIIIGDTSSLDNTLLDIFRAVGLIHIVVLSGYNITLVANFFIRMFAPLGYYRRLVVAMVALVLFIAIVGISPTATRAGIMALCAFSARYFVRPYMVTRGIMLALVIMVWISPYAFLFDLSLQLSFLATIGIVYIFPLLQERYQTIAGSTFGEILLQTIAVNSTTLPLIIYQMGIFSFISFPINIMVLGIIPWITMAGFFAVFMGMVVFPLGQIIAFPIQVVIDVIINISTWVSRHDPFHVSIAPFSVYWILVFYIVILVRLSVRKDMHLNTLVP